MKSKESAIRNLVAGPSCTCQIIRSEHNDYIVANTFSVAIKFIAYAALILFSTSVIHNASAGTITIIGPSSVDQGSTAEYSLTHEIDWDRPVTPNINLVDELSHLEFGELKVYLDGIEIAGLDRPSPSTYTTNPNGSYGGGQAMSEWNWTFSRVFDVPGAHQLSFEGWGYFWRQVIPPPGCNCGGFTGQGRTYFSGSTTLDVIPTMSPVPIPAAAWLFGGALVGLVAVKRKRS